MTVNVYIGIKIVYYLGIQEVATLEFEAHNTEVSEELFTIIDKST